MTPSDASEANGQRFKTCVFDCVPPDAIGLIWQVFFASRNRGITPEFHFPWINEKRDIYCVCAVTDGESAREIAATLVLQHKDLGTGKQFGLIGLVCVASQFRGVRLSSQILERAIQLAKNQKLTHLVLWTKKPTLYEKFGFEVDDTDLFGTINRCLDGTSEVDLVKKFSIGKIDSKLLSGAPAFAEEVVRYSSVDGASIIVCRSGSTQTIVEHAGELDRVLGLIENVMPETWNLNVQEHAHIIGALRDYGYQIKLKPSAVRMTLALDQSEHQSLMIPFLARI